MADLSVTVRMRPTRIGFLVRPTDMTSIRKIMRSCVCLWGGGYNPIIPVFKVPPKAWRGERWESIKGSAIAKGYVNFFEPDVYVESEKGLLEEAGLGAWREKHSLEKHVVELDHLFQAHYQGDPAEPVLGLSMAEVYQHIYRTDRRFQTRKESPAVLVDSERGSALVDAVFGVFPTQKDTTYFLNAYKDVFSPKKVKASPKTWLEIFKNGAEFPLGVCRYGLDTRRHWNHDLVIYVFDPTQPTDLVDLWNLRLEPSPVLPVPIDWFDALADELRDVIAREYRPVRGNAHGVMHHPKVEFGRSIAEAKVNELVEPWRGRLPAGALSIKMWRNRIWTPLDDDRIYRDRRRHVTADEQRTTCTVKAEKNLFTAELPAISPEFASRYGGGEFRWVNAVQIASYSSREKYAIALPFNVFDKRWPVANGLSGFQIGSEGWVFGQKFKGWSEHLNLMTGEQAILGWLEHQGIQAKLSEPGHIAKQMLDHLGGLWAVHMLADLETIQLLNKMAGGIRVRGNGVVEVEETFERRTAPVKTWIDLVARRRGAGRLSRLNLSNFTERNVIRLGLETDCPNCQATNWHTLSAVDYAIVCERCLNQYDFPQADLKDRNQNWCYRVVGPFSVPDYGRGSYGALLCLRFLKSCKSNTDEMTYATATNLTFDEITREVDFLAWKRSDKFDEEDPPELIIGEAKSTGKGNLIKSGDLNKLKDVARKLPGAFIVVSVIKENFTPREKLLLRNFAKWTRRLNDRGRVTNPLILLTSRELFFDFSLSATWKNLGKPWSSFADFHHTRNLYSIADASQQIYLGLPSFDQEIHARWEARSARRKSQARDRRTTARRGG